MRGKRAVFVGMVASVALWAPCAMAQPAAKDAAPPSSASTSAPSPARAEARALTAHDFAALPFVEGMRLSPNGERVAGLFGVKGQRVICAISLFDKDAKRTCAAVPDKMEAYAIRWVNDDNFLVHVKIQTPVDGDLWYVSRLVAVNCVTGKLTQLLSDSHGQSADTVIWTARDGSPYALIGAQDSIYTGMDFWPAVYRVNVETGQKTRILSGQNNIMGWVADSTGQIRLGYGHDDDKRRDNLLYRGEQGGAFHILDRADQRKRETTLEPMGFIPGTSHALLVHDDDHGNNALFESDLEPVKDVKALYTAPEKSWIDQVILGDDELTPLGVDLRGTVQKRVWIDPDLTKIQAALDTSVGDRRARIISFSRDRQRMLVLIDQPDTPGSLYFYDINGGSMHRIAFMNDRLTNTRLSPVRMVTYHARDGLAIEAVVTTPRAAAPKKLPVIIMPHGGPWAHDTLDYDYWAQFLAERGYLVIQPNFRGSTGYGEAFERKGEGQLGLAMQDDLNDALAWAVDQGLADPKRACIVGASYGGYAAMWGAARDPDLWRCAISIAGVSSLRREVNDMGYNSLNANANTDGWSRMTPDFAAVSPINAVSRIKIPLLLVHGKVDVTVAIRQSTAMAARMRAAGKPVEFVEVPLADHYFTREADRLTLLEAIGTFLDKNNPAH